MKKNQTIELPVLPLRGLMLFPNMVLHFDVGQKEVPGRSGTGYDGPAEGLSHQPEK